jgi:hypothetical protein
VKQNVVHPTIPSPYEHWQSRYGAAVVVLSNSSIGAADSLFILGGDTYDNSNLPVDLNIRSADFSHGYKNDVWVNEGTEWKVLPDISLRNKHEQKIPRQTSFQTWEKKQAGRLTPVGVTYEEWISCQLAVSATNPNFEDCNLPKWDYDVQWSPRRFAQALFFKDYIWVMGGRARESVQLPESRSVGGIFNPKVEDVTSPIANEQKFTNHREASVLKSDVWKSRDGVTWELVTPGCKSPQKDLVAAGNPAGHKVGKKEAQCVTDSDCYLPAELCMDLNGTSTCVCNMWSPREQHQASVFNGYMYVVGGYASQLFDERSNCGDYACGDVDASAYRAYMNDVWRSKDGENWELITNGSTTEETRFPGRGGHQMLLLPAHKSIPAYFYVFGGRGGDPTTNDLIYYNDVWRTPAHDTRLWEQVNTSLIGWEPRTSHVAILETPSALNQNTRNILLYGGKSADGEILQDVWMWRPDFEGDPWRSDYQPNALYRKGSGATFSYDENSPATTYVYPDAPIEYLRHFWVPPSDEPGMGDGLRPKELSFLTTKRLSQLHFVGIQTIRDLATANKYQILRLRGHDYPQVEETDLMDFVDVCSARRLAEAVVDKCTVADDIEFYDGNTEEPWKIKNEWGGAPPAAGSNPLWHDVDYSPLHVVKTLDEVIEDWDGCENLPQFTLPNVIGLGKVSQVSYIANPASAVQELQCRYNPGPRMMHSGAYFEERFYIFGGFTEKTKLAADSWYRDDRMPKVAFKKKPPSHSSVPHFRFTSDEGGVAYEYRVWDPVNFKELREWTPVVSKTSVYWLDWREGGPGNGVYTFYVRGIDPGGNRDEEYESDRNVYTWYYESPIPWDIILGSLFGFLFLCLVAYLEYRRRVKRAAMERYAMKRMRRKFKAMQTDQDNRQVDWRTLYNESKADRESKDPEVIKRQKKAQANNNKAKIKREKEVSKREKEKDKIKKKLAGARKDGSGGSSANAGSSAMLDAFSKVITS